MQKNSTDQIAKQAWEATKSHWKVFVLMPLLPMGLIICSGIILNTKLIIEADSKLIALSQLFYWGGLLFYMVYSTAAAQWCKEIFSGEKQLQIKAGLRYGCQRLGGVIGTAIVTTFKLFLWTLLLIIPGFYKTLTYSQSIHITQLEKISGEKANRLSEMLVEEAGILRTLGNYMSVFLLYTGFLIIYLIVFLPGNTTMTPEITGDLVLFFIIVFVFYIFVLAFITCFGNFQYLTFREENKAAFEKAIKGMK